ncbi:MAG: hypothetical protein IME93_07500, partial [Proteobacteria bacterium]|nr:hypothetical protein [Pseudomonadota bacterium]
MNLGKSAFPIRSGILIKITIALSVVMALSACIVTPRHGRHDYYDEPQTRAPVYDSYSYWYYPAVDVYFDIHREVYFYLDAGRWITVRVLPPRFRGYMGARVDLRMRHDRPYTRHRNHKRSYPKHKYRRAKSRDYNKHWRAVNKNKRHDRRRDYREDRRDRRNTRRDKRDDYNRIRNERHESFREPSR